MFTLSLNLAMALGNGTRQAKEPLATIADVQPNELLAHAFELVGQDLSQLPGTIVPADGVLPGEVLTALRNPQLCDFQPVVSKKQKLAEPDADEDEEPEPVAAPKSAPASPRNRKKK